jgi:uncharacterized protein (DUF4415 family)
MRLGGNPDLKKFEYKPKGKQALSKQISLKVEEELALALKADPNWHDKMREVLRSIYLKDNSSPGENLPSLDK